MTILSQFLRWDDSYRMPKRRAPSMEESEKLTTLPSIMATRWHIPQSQIDSMVKKKSLPLTLSNSILKGGW